MIGTRKLGEIRNGIRKALAADGQDPIKRLDKMITESKRRGENTEMTEGLKRFLRGKPKRKRRNQRAGSKK